MKKLVIYTDGSCLDNQSKENYGGWAFIVVEEDGVCRDVCGAAKNTTNNQMEMTAVIKALNWLIPTERSEAIVTIYSDSAYVVNCFKDEWYKGWQKNGWKNSKNKPVENKELWEAILTLKAQYAAVEFKKVAGHSGDANNEKCDSLCVMAAEKLKAEDTSNISKVVFVEEGTAQTMLPVYKTPSIQPTAPKAGMTELEFAIKEMRNSQLSIGSYGTDGDITVTGEMIAGWLQSYLDIIKITGGRI